MTTTDYLVLPPERTWDDATEQLARALVDGAGDNTSVLAALGFLFRDPVHTFGRPDIRRDYVIVHTAVDVDLDWSLLSDHAITGRSVILTAQQRALFVLAASIASPRCYASLRETLPVLGDDLLHAFFDAVGYAGHYAGSRDGAR